MFAQQIYDREDIEALKSAMPQFADRYFGNSEVRSVDLSLAPEAPQEETGRSLPKYIDLRPLPWRPWCKPEPEAEEVAPKPEPVTPSKPPKPQRTLRGEVKKHGHSGYSNYGCSCEICKGAALAWQRKDYAKKKAKRDSCPHPPDRWQKHGKQEICADCGKSRTKGIACAI